MRYLQTRSNRFLGVLFLFFLLIKGPFPAFAAENLWLLETWERPFDYSSPSRTVQYAPLASASKKWRICASYPHLKDSYWLSVNYGMVEEARRLGVALRVVEAGGYPNLSRQISQIQECTAKNTDILVIGGVSFKGVTPTIKEIAKRIPVVAVVNDIADDGITAKTGVSWISMGRRIGEFLARAHPKGSAPVKVAWFPGPKASGWVPFVEEGFRSALADSSAEIVVTKYGDTGKEVQLILIEEALEERPDVDYLVGSAVTAGAAVSVLRAKGLSKRIKVLADYFTHAVYRGIKRGKILAAPTDFAIVQGRLGIEQAVRVLEGKLTLKHVGPAITLIDSKNVNEIGTSQSLAPATFTPTFIIE
ncbi:MAG: TMAO reductase system periplasmic protein TorT [Alphaproteobacteria bacterium]|jgi:periplasmic protein TorT|nr:TMAO reductase system periplasmic protein TorT [Alphaproteobacteria bacterium]MBT6240437.1 TMAO reductase system periplasmic protein TorT [Rhodospirillaceae bacterium]